MSKIQRGVRDGTGSFDGSYQTQISNKGRRKEAGEECPNAEQESEEERASWW